MGGRGTTVPGVGVGDGAKARMEAVGLEFPGNAAMELTEALQAQTSAMQGQACIKEQLCMHMSSSSASTFSVM